jgi:hypothetical protein
MQDHHVLSVGFDQRIFGPAEQAGNRRPGQSFGQVAGYRTP